VLVQDREPQEIKVPKGAEKPSRHEGRDHE